MAKIFKTLLVSIVLLSAFAVTAHADESDEEGTLVKDTRGGVYLKALCKDPKESLSKFDSFWEAVPILGGKYKDAQTSCCLKNLEKACAENFEDMQPPTEAFANCGPSLVGQCQGAACAAWANDCLGSMTDTLKYRKLIKEYLKNNK